MSIVKKEIKIGLLTIAALLILGWGVNFLKGHNVLKAGTTYYGVYGNVSGMNEACPIFYRGLKIGSVKNIELDPVNDDKLLVTFNITKDIEFPKNSVARIYSLDLMGTKGVEIVKGNSQEMLMQYDTIKTYVVGDLKDQIGIEMLPLKDKMEKLMVNFDSLIIDINKLFIGDNMDNLENGMKMLNRTLANTANMTGYLAKSFSDGGEYHTIMKRIDSILISLNKQTPYLDTTFTNIAEFSKGLNKVELSATLQELNNSLKQTSELLAGLNSGGGSMGMLLKDEQLYYNLVDASANLNRLLMDVRHQPKKYVRFSAIDFGKTYYSDDMAEGGEGIVFQVKLFESKTPVKLESYEVANKYRIFEDYNGRKFIYTIGQSKTYDDIKKVLEEAGSAYPNSEIIALDNGRLISVNKAIKKLEK
jgi:phospholipid/cholesterol/gamma-HCH transport system substrate-binding protein